MHHPGSCLAWCETIVHRGTVMMRLSYMRNYLLVGTVLSKNKFKRFTRNVIVYRNFIRTFVKQKTNTMIIDFHSNCHTLDTDTLIVTPFFEDKGIHIDELEDSWFDTLDDHDFGTMKNIIDKRQLQTI